VVKVSTVCTIADACAGGTPITLTSSVELITPNAIPSAPSTIWAAKPTAMNGNRAERSIPKIIRTLKFGPERNG